MPGDIGGTSSLGSGWWSGKSQRCVNFEFLELINFKSNFVNCNFVVYILGQGVPGIKKEWFEK